MSAIEPDQLRPLGATGVRVSPLCLGAMMFGAWGNPDHDSCVAIVRHAIDAGFNFIDTADVYSFGESEQIIGKALAGVDRERVVLATWCPSDEGASASVPSSRRTRSSCVGSRGMSYVPVNQKKFELVTQLAELADRSGLSMIELAIGFVLEHPAVSAAIIGPRTMQQLVSQLPAAHTQLTPDVLDRIDEIIAPGVDVNPEDGAWPSPALSDPRLRRRSSHYAEQ